MRTATSKGKITLIFNQVLFSITISTLKRLYCMIKSRCNLIVNIVICETFLIHNGLMMGIDCNLGVLNRLQCTNRIVIKVTYDGISNSATTTAHTIHVSKI